MSVLLFKIQFYWRICAEITLQQTMCRSSMTKLCDSILHDWILISHLWLGQQKFLFSHWPTSWKVYRPFHAANCLSSISFILIRGIECCMGLLYASRCHVELPAGRDCRRVTTTYIFLSVIDFWLLSYRHPFPHVYKILQRDNCQNTLWTNYIETLSTGRYNKYRNCANIFEQSLTSYICSFNNFVSYLFIFVSSAEGKWNADVHFRFQQRRYFSHERNNRYR
jgi:hypothetical protein